MRSEIQDHDDLSFGEVPWAEFLEKGFDGAFMVGEWFRSEGGRCLLKVVDELRVILVSEKAGMLGGGAGSAVPLSRPSRGFLAACLFCSWNT